MTMKKTVMWALAAAGIVSASVAGCAPQDTEDPNASTPTASSASRSDAPTTSTTPAARPFWSSSAIVSALEVDPAQDLADLSDQATVIVRGPIERIEAGPSFPVTSDDGKTDPGGTSLVTVRVVDAVKGSPGQSVTVWLSGAYPAASAPTDPYLWYLKPSERPGVMYPASRTGVIGPGDDGALTTVLTPGDTGIIVPPGVRSVDQLQNRTEGLVTP